MEKEPIVSLVKRPAMTRLPSVLRNNKKGEGEEDAKMTDDYTQYIRWAILQWQWNGGGGSSSSYCMINGADDACHSTNTYAHVR